MSTPLDEQHNRYVVITSVEKPRDVISQEQGLLALVFTKGNTANIEFMSSAELRQARDAIDAALKGMS